MRRKGYVYFAARGGLIKIGFSRNPRVRTAGQKAEIIGLCEGDRAMERQLHWQFSDLRVNGEWFGDQGRIRRYIETLQKIEPPLIKTRWRTIKIGAGEYRDLRAYAERAGMKIQAVLTRWIREGLERANGQAKEGQQ